MAKGTRGAGLQVHGGAAVGAVYFLNGFPQMLNLQGRERTNEVLFLKKIKKADEVAVLTGALPVDKAHVASHVVGQREFRAAARTHEPIGERRLRRRGVVPDIFHQL